MFANKNITVAIIAVVALLLQVVLAPYIAISSIVPDMAAVAMVLIAVVRADRFGVFAPFIVGLVYDLVTGGPLGAMAFTLTLVSFLASRLFAALDNDTSIMPLIISAAALLLVEVIYAVFLALLGYSGGLLGMLAYRALPVFLYDIVLAIVLYPLFRRLLYDAAPIQTAITRLR